MERLTKSEDFSAEFSSTRIYVRLERVYFRLFSSRRGLSGGGGEGQLADTVEGDTMELKDFRKHPI